MDASNYRLADRMCAVPDGKEMFWELWELFEYQYPFSTTEARTKRISRVVEILNFFNNHGFSDRQIEDALRL